MIKPPAHPSDHELEISSFATIRKEKGIVPDLISGDVAKVPPLHESPEQVFIRTVDEEATFPISQHAWSEVGLIIIFAVTVGSQLIPSAYFII